MSPSRADNQHRDLLVDWGRTLRRDPLTRAGLATLGIIVLLYLAPGIPRERLRAWSGGIFLLALALWPMLAAFSQRRRTAHPEERRFWAFVGSAFACWVAASIVSMSPWWESQAAPLTLLYDALFVASSLALLLATTEVPHRPAGWRRTLGTQRLVYAGALIFGVGMTVYFDLLPFLFDRAAFESRIPGYLLYLALDAAILVRALALLRATTDPRWRLVYGLFFAAAAFSTAGDALDALNRAERFVYQAPGWDFIWYAIFPPLALAARIPDSHSPARNASTMGVVPFGTPLISFALLVPLIHLSLTIFDPDSPVGDAAHRIVALVTMIALLALARVQESRLERRGRELEREVERARERLASAEKLEAVGRLAGGVAHDFNNKLAVILGYTEHLAADVAHQPRLAEGVEAIRSAAEDAAGLTAKLLAVGQRQFLVSNLLDLDAAIAELAPSLRATLGGEIALEIVSSPTPALALADRGGFERAIHHLVANSREALDGRGRVRIVTVVVEIGAAELPPLAPRGPGYYVRVEVGDDGPGVPPEIEQHLFEPFFTTKPFGAGHGLGLAAVRGIVEQCGGFVTSESAPGAGFRCRLHFPHARQTPSGQSRIDPLART